MNGPLLPPFRCRCILYVAAALTALSCREEPAPPAPQAKTPPTAQSPHLTTDTPSTRQTDSLTFRIIDEPNAPAFLPRNNEFGKWVRHSSARVAEAPQISRLIQDSARLDVLAPYQVRRVIACSYRWSDAEMPLIAQVELIEADAPLDALGMLSVHCLAAEDGKPGVITRVPVNETTHFYGWQGTFFAHLWAVSKDDAFLANCDQFLRKLVFRIPGEEPPLWLSLLPATGRLPNHRWIVRQTASLGGPSARKVPLNDPQRIDQILGLGRETILMVVAYCVPDDEAPNYVWLVCYPTPDDAQAAYRRYKAFLDAGDQPLALNTLIEPAKGNFLLGTWTADQESLLHILPAIRKAVPDRL
jgi:hypothetical protein